MRNKFLVAFIAMFSISIMLTAQEKETDSDDFNRWKVRLRAISVIPNESADIGIIGGDIEIGTAIVPELDFTYFFTKNWAAELILGTTKHDVNTTESSLVAIGGPSSTAVDLGSVWLLPPTLTAQYHFNGEKLHPYIGAGINYTIFYSADEGDTVAGIEYDNAIGFAFQGGFDYDLNDTWFLNLDAKYILLKTDVTVDASNLAPGLSIPAEVTINPLIVGLGVGMRF